MEDAHIRLRPTVAEDLAFVLAAEQAAENARFINQWTRDRHLQACHHPNERHWLVVAGSQAVPAGYVILLDVEDPHRCLHLKRIVITQKGQGLGKTTLRTTVQRVFEEFNAHRLWLDVLEDNVRARSLYHQVGFVEEGKLRECYQRPEGFVSAWIMAMLRSEYLARQAHPAIAK